MPGKLFGDAHQFGIFGLLERRHGGEQRRVVDLHLMAFGNWLELLQDLGTQDRGIHPRQRPQVEFE
ncbi:hypothetical protein D3C76_1474620 [compost metagenome]